MGSKAGNSKTSTYELKTKPSSQSVTAFLEAVPDDIRRGDAFTLLELFQELSPAPPIMWGDKIVGFGSYHYRYASGGEGDWPRTGFSPGSAHCTVYIMPGFKGQESLLAKLGPHKHSVSCLYLRRLDAIDMNVLRELIRQSLVVMAERYPES